ncbi:MAG: hypothetical protein WCI77_08055 [Candidatus Omnitrophota bacterium]
MANTVRENILANIKTVLTGITVAGGYANTIASVQRWNQSGNSFIDTPCLIINAGPEEKEHRPGFITSCKLSVLIDLWVIKPTDSDTYLNSLLGDVEKALMTDYTRGGYAANTKLLGVLPFEAAEGQPYCGLIINVEIEYRHKSTDPTTAV